MTGDSALSADRHYNAAARLLHWTIAVLFLVQIGLGWYMNEVLPDHSPARRLPVTLHISIGLTILLLVLARIVVRLIHRPPPLPAGMPVWEKGLAHLVHFVFYFLMLAMPLTGWAMISLGTYQIHFWGLPWPHMPGESAMFGPSPPKSTHEAISHIHVFILMWIVVVNLALHVAGALKHQFDGHPVLWRMTGTKRPL